MVFSLKSENIFSLYQLTASGQTTISVSVLFVISLSAYKSLLNGCAIDILNFSEPPS